MLGTTIVTVQPLTEPVHLLEAKAHLRVEAEEAGDDVVITTMLAAARQRIEAITARRLITQTLQTTFDRFPSFWYQSRARSMWLGPWVDVMELEGPVQSVTSLKYIDPTGTLQTVDPSLYLVDNASIPPRLAPNIGVVWPVPANEVNAVVIVHVAGYGDTPATVPARFRLATLLLAGHYYENREQVLSGRSLVAIEVPEGVNDLLSNDKPALVG